MKSEIFKNIPKGLSLLNKKFASLASGIFLILLTNGLSYGQTEESAGGVLANLTEVEVLLLVALGLLILLALLVLVVAIYVVSFLRLVGADGKEKAAVEDKKKEGSLWARLNRRFVSGELVPVGQEKDIMLDHSYDGISELDNHMPPWLKYTFYGTIGFAVVYVMHYLVLGTGALQLDEYQAELAEAEALTEERSLLATSSIDENTAVLVSGDAELENGELLYVQNCSPCHAKDGGGTVGPNLTDEYWIHGGSVKDIFSVIKYGVQEKGMIPWEGKLKPEEIQNVASYILTLQGTTPANPKEPQGDKYEREASEQEALSSLN